MTLMVRDEVDVIGAMLEHHARQGIDVFIVTDNGSVDGTIEVIEEFAKDHDVDLRHDPEHKKQQIKVVSGMARDAATKHGVDWVINADADEFWVPVDRGLRIHDCVQGFDPVLGSFPVPVIDMTGAPALSGTGLGRLVYRDTRPLEMMFRVGLHEHSTADTMHIADPEVVVSHGNHFVSTPSTGTPPPALQLEVLHLSWRSWQQFERKVRNAGEAFAANPELKPSPNHHGLREYRRLLAGVLEQRYAVRHPDADELAHGQTLGWYRLDRTLADAGLPGFPDVLYDDTRLAVLREDGAKAAVADAEEIRVAFIESKKARVENLEQANIDLRDQLLRTERELADARRLVEQYRSRRIVRLADSLARLGRGPASH